jgi:DNA-binding beta-propeller fold protein YncE
VPDGQNASLGDLLAGPPPARPARRPRRWPLVIGVLAGTALIAATAVIQVRDFLWGGVPVVAVGAGTGSPVLSTDGRTLYVPRAGSGITPVSVAAGTVGRLIPVSGGGPVGALAVTPDGRTMFAEVRTESSTDPAPPLARIDLRAGRQTGQVDVPGGVFNFALSHDGRVLYIISAFIYRVDKDNNVTGQVDAALYAVDAATGRTERRIPVAAGVLDNPTVMVLSPDGGTLYLADRDPDSVTGTVNAVNLRTGAITSAVSLGYGPTALAITPDGRTLYVTTSGLYAEDQQLGPPSRLVVIDTATGRIRASLPWRAQPIGLTMAPDGQTVWVVSVTGTRETTADNTVTPVTVATNRPGSSFHASGWLNNTSPLSAVAVSPDSRTLYLTVGSGLETFRVSNHYWWLPW